PVLLGQQLGRAGPAPLRLVAGRGEGGLHADAGDRPRAVAGGPRRPALLPARGDEGVGKLLGLPYPAGPAVGRALQPDARQVRLVLVRRPGLAAHVPVAARLRRGALGRLGAREEDRARVEDALGRRGRRGRRGRGVPAGRHDDAGGGAGRGRETGGQQDGTAAAGPAAEPGVRPGGGVRLGGAVHGAREVVVAAARVPLVRQVVQGGGAQRAEGRVGPHAVSCGHRAASSATWAAGAVRPVVPVPVRAPVPVLAPAAPGASRARASRRRARWSRTAKAGAEQPTTFAACRESRPCQLTSARISRSRSGSAATAASAVSRSTTCAATSQAARSWGVVRARMRSARARPRRPRSRCLCSRLRATPSSQGSAGSPTSSSRRQAIRKVSPAMSSAVWGSAWVSAYASTRRWFSSYRRVNRDSGSSTKTSSRSGASCRNPSGVAGFTVAGGVSQRRRARRSTASSITSARLQNAKRTKCAPASAWS